MKNIKCMIFGHKFLINFMTMGNRVICSRCSKKMELDLKTLEWNDVEKFSSIIGSDEEIKNRWKNNKI